jgi:predicted acyltransferase
MDRAPIPPPSGSPRAQPSDIGFSPLSPRGKQGGEGLLAGAAPGRLRALDVFRGATVALMIVVNNAGDWSKTYAPLLHAEWHGWTPTDLVFPFFLFIVGVAIPFALVPGQADTGRKIWRRAAILFALGLFLTWFPFYTVAWERVRLPGVLQRIALVYLAAAFAYLYCSPRIRAALAAALLASYWLLMRLAPVPGFGAGDLSPKGNVAFWLDSQILGAHIWRYSPGPGDPEGILSTLPAIVTALLGLCAGELLRAALPVASKLRRLLAWGALATVSGLALAPLFPINKNLWSPTYTLFTAGAALLCLAATWYLVDLRPGRWTPKLTEPLALFGRGAIVAYVGSGLMAKVFLYTRWHDDAGTQITLHRHLYQTLYAPHLPDYVASLAWALSYLVLWWAILALLERRGVRVKI